MDRTSGKARTSRLMICVLLALSTSGIETAVAGDKKFSSVRAFGAHPNDGLDDTAGIQKALDAGGVVYVPPGKYEVSDTLHIKRWGTTLAGADAFLSFITYTGKKFINVIEVDTYSGVRIIDLTISGGARSRGNAKYLVYAKNFHRGCEITRCVLREGIGLIRIDSGYYSRVHDVDFRDVTPDRRLTSITHKQWLEVHGENSAPIHLKKMSACNLNDNKYFRLGSKSNGVITRYGVRVAGTGSFDNGAFEQSSPWREINKELNVRFTSDVQTLLRIDGWLGTADNLYFEWNRASKALIEIDGRASRPSIRGGLIYAVECDTIVNYIGRNDLIIDNFRMRAVKANWLFRADQAGNRGVIFRNSTMRAGGILRDPAAAEKADEYVEPGNQFDTGTRYPLGPREPKTPGRDLSRRVFPRSLNRYKVTTGNSARKGRKAMPYVQVIGGTFQREDGRVVHAVSRTPALMRVRPDENGKFYRVIISSVGHAYLSKHESPPKVPTGNWIAEFKVDRNGTISGLSENPRLKMRGEYLPGTSNCRVWLDRVPKAGYWLVGDRTINTKPAAGGYVGWICTKEGMAPTEAVFKPYGPIGK